MRSIPAVLCAFALLAAAPVRADVLADARAAYAARADVGQAKRAVELYEQAATAEPGSYEANWEGARAIYYLGNFPLSNRPDKEREPLFERGIALARAAVALRADGVEGHFWLGVLLGVYGEARGVFKSLSLVPEIRAEMETCIKLDPSVEGWGPDRLLGRMLYKLPWFKGGDKKESLEHLEKSLHGAPTNALTRLYLADTLKALGRKPEALKRLDEIVVMEPDPRWAPEQPFIVREARDRASMWR